MSKQVNFEKRKIADLKKWENNPRTVLKEDFARLKGQIEKLGVYKTLLVNQDNIVLGGNMRLEAFKQMFGAEHEIMCGIIQTDNEGEMLEYALSDNDNVGVTDDLKLAEVYHLFPIETSLFKIQSNVLRPLESIINSPDPITQGGEAGADRDEISDDLDTYLHGTIKQIVLLYKNEEYAEIVPMLEDLKQDGEFDNYTELLTQLIKDAHGNLTAQKASN